MDTQEIRKRLIHTRQAIEEAQAQVHTANANLNNAQTQLLMLQSKCPHINATEGRTFDGGCGRTYMHMNCQDCGKLYKKLRLDLSPNANGFYYYELEEAHKINEEFDKTRMVDTSEGES